MFTTITILAVASVGAALVTGARVIGLKRIVKHSTKADVAFTAGIGFVLAGTLTGLATAIVAGLIMALVLSVLKAAYKVSDRVSGAWDWATAKPVYADEINAGGWVYNQAPYA